MLITIVSFLCIIIVIILAHELGHFITAKSTGVKIEEFGLGYPPRLFGIKRGETIYSLNAMPLGGFVKMAGEEDPKAPGSLASKGIGARLLVLSAGSIMNALLPLILFILALAIPHNVVVGQLMVEEVALNSPAAMAGIEVGDTIISLNDKPIQNISDLQRYTTLNLGRETDLLIRHSDSTTEEVQLIPRWRPPEGEAAMGVMVKLENITTIKQREPFWRAIPLGIKEGIETLGLFKNSILSLIVGTSSMEIAGPVGIAQMTGEVARAGLSPLLEFAAFLSINLAIINMFPLPALDGGRIVFVLLEWLRRGKRISPRVEGIVHGAGFALLIAVMIVVTYQDIIRIISGNNLIP